MDWLVFVTLGVGSDIPESVFVVSGVAIQPIIEMKISATKETSMKDVFWFELCILSSHCIR